MPDKVPCSSTERIMGMTMDEGASDRMGRILLFFKGRLDEALLERAVELTIEAEPILGYRYVYDPWRSYWSKVGDEARVKPFRFIRCARSDDRLYDFMIEPIPLERAPLFRVGLLRSDDDVLCIKVHHMIMDGGGALAFLGLLSSCYRELSRDPNYHPAPQIGRPNGPREVLRNGGLAPAIKGLPKIGIRGPTWGIPKHSDDLAGRAFMVRQLGPARVGALRDYARLRGVTVNDVLLTTYYRSLFKIADPPRSVPLRIEVPIALRKYLPPGRRSSVCNLAGVFFPTIDRRDDERFEDTLTRVHSAMNAMKQRKEELAEMLFIELVLLPGMFLIKGAAKFIDFEIAHPALSNLGVVDPALVDFGAVQPDDVQTLGPVHFPPNVGMGVNTFRQRMTLSLTYCDTAVETETMERLFELFLGELPGKEYAGEDVRILYRRSSDEQ